MSSETEPTKDIQHLWTMICGSSSIDRDSNNVSLFNVLEQVTLDESQVKNAKVKQQKSDIAIPITFELVSLWERNETDETVERSCRLELLSPADRVLLYHDLPLKFAEGKSRYRLRAKFQGLKITTAGRYHFSFLLPDANGKNRAEVARVPLEIKIVRKDKKNQSG